MSAQRLPSVVKILSIFVLVILIPVSYSYWYYTEYDTLGKILLQYYTDPVRAAEYHTE